jgi:hypothetical protein
MRNSTAFHLLPFPTAAKRHSLRWLAWVILLAIAPLLKAQSQPSAELRKEERELAAMANTLLNNDSTDLKLELNKEFIERLTSLLQKPETYHYPFDSLKTVSILRPADDSFRIFTWYVADRASIDTYYGSFAHYHFGLIQRKHLTPDGKEMIIVIPLMELDGIPKGFESIVTDNYNWLGALYYAPKGEKFIPSYDGFYYKLVSTGESGMAQGKGTVIQSTFNPGKPRTRAYKRINTLEVKGHKRVKQEVRYYVLTGWNGWDDRSSYKLVDVLSFDPEDSSKAIFGAPIFYFDALPKARGLFKYSDYASFTLNYGTVHRGPFNLRKERMLVYDHLAAPKYSKPTDMYEMGPDGTHDALKYFKRYGGYFEWYRNVDVGEDTQNRKHRKEVEKLQLEAMRSDTALFPDYEELMKGKPPVRIEKMRKKELERQRRATEAELRKAGIDLHRGRPIRNQETEEEN